MDVLHGYGNTPMVWIGNQQTEHRKGNLWKRGNFSTFPLLSRSCYSGSESCPPSSPSGEFLLPLCWNLWLLICGLWFCSSFYQSNRRKGTALQRWYWLLPMCMHWLPFLPGGIQLYSELTCPSPQMPHGAHILCLVRVCVWWGWWGGIPTSI